MSNEINYEINNCITDLDTLKVLDKRAVKDLENNTHEIEQQEVLTIIREFIRLRNDYNKEKERNKELEEEHQRRVMLALNKELVIVNSKMYIIDKELYNDLLNDIVNNYIRKSKVQKALGLDEDLTDEKILNYIDILVSENNRLEDIEDKKVQIEYQNVFNKGVKSVEDKIKKELNELEDMKVDGEVFTTAVNFAKKILKELLEEGDDK